MRIEHSIVKRPTVLYQYYFDNISRVQFVGYSELQYLPIADNYLVALWKIKYKTPCPPQS